MAAALRELASAQKALGAAQVGGAANGVPQNGAAAVAGARPGVPNMNGAGVLPNGTYPNGSTPSGNAAAAGGAAAQVQSQISQNNSVTAGVRQQSAAMDILGKSAELTSKNLARAREELEKLTKIRNAPNADAQLDLAKSIAGSTSGGRQLMNRATNDQVFGQAENRVTSAEIKDSRAQLRLNNRAAAEDRAAQIAEDRRMGWRARVRLRSNHMEENRVAKAERAAQSAQTSAMYEGRRDTMDKLWGGMILSGAGAAMLQPAKYGLDQYGQAQRARIGVQAIEGSNSGAVMEQARKDALDMFGASYRDVLNSQMLLRQSGQSTEQARSSVLAMSDINAATGGDAPRLQRNLYNLSQVEQQGKLTGRDLRDFAVNMVPIREALAKRMGISNAEVSEKVSNGEVTADIVREALMSIAKDPRFAGRAKAISEGTPQGQWEKTREEMDKTAEMAGETLAPAMMGLNKAMRWTLEGLQKAPGLTKGVTWGVTGAGVLAAGAGATMMASSGFNQVMQAFGKGPMNANTAATIANTQALVATAGARGAGSALDLAGDAAAVGGGGLGAGGGAAAGAGGTAAAGGGRLATMWARVKGVGGGIKSGAASAGGKASGAWGAAKALGGKTAFTIPDAAAAANAARAGRIAGTAGAELQAGNALTAAQKAVPVITDEMRAVSTSVKQAGALAEAAKAAKVGSAAEGLAGARAAAQAAGQAPIAEAGMLGKLGLAGKGVTVARVGGSALSVAGGAIGGTNNFYDAKRAGYSDGFALASGTFVGVGEAAIAMFVPGGAVAVALVEGFKAAANAELDEQDRQDAKGTTLAPEQKAQLKGASSQESAANEWLFKKQEAEKGIKAWREKWGDADGVTERASDEWKTLQADYSQAHRNERVFRRSAQTVANEKSQRQDEAASQQSLKEYVEGRGGTYIPPGGGTAAPQAQVQKVRPSGDGGRLVTLLLPPTDAERDLQQGTYKSH